MSASDSPRLPSRPEPSGERVFFVLASAFLGVTAVIVTASFAPVGLAVGICLAVIGVAVWLVLAFLSRLIGED